MVKTREEVLAEMAEKEIDKQTAEGTIKDFLSEEGIGDAVLKVRSDVYNKYLKPRIDSNPRLANDKSTFDAVYGMALDQYEADKKAPAPEVAKPAPAAEPAPAVAPASPRGAADVPPVEAKNFDDYAKANNLNDCDKAMLRNSLQAVGVDV